MQEGGGVGEVRFDHSGGRVLRGCGVFDFSGKRGGVMSGVFDSLGWKRGRRRWR